jgi:transposase
LWTDRCGCSGIDAGCVATAGSARSVSSAPARSARPWIRALTKAGERVVKANRPNRLARRMDGKSDRLDFEQIARAVLGQTSTAIPKSKSGMIEVIRTLRVTRASAIKSRTQAFNTLWGVMIGAPAPLRDELSF